MTCTGSSPGAAERLLQITAYLDGELDLTAAVELERHVEECAGCKRALEAQRALGEAIRANAGELRFRPSPEEARRLRRALGGGAAPPVWWLSPPSQQLRSLAALLLVAVGAWSVGRRWPGVPASSESSATSAAQAPAAAPGAPAVPITEEILASHLRALLAGHPEDVASSDRHTVKPWFAGRIDYSPPVVDLAAQGFPLRGGRLDYVAGRPVAVLVYQAGNHLASVYVWPADAAAVGAAAGGAASATGAAGAPAAASSRRGFQLLRWTQADMTWWAVSDVAPEHLAELVRKLRQALPASPAPPPPQSPPRP
jgi:anti-sigma factor RsiW